MNNWNLGPYRAKFEFGVLKSFPNHQESNVWVLADRYWCPYFFQTLSEQKVRAFWNFVAEKVRISLDFPYFAKLSEIRKIKGNPHFFGYEISKCSNFLLRQSLKKIWTPISIRKNSYVRFLMVWERFEHSKLEFRSIWTQVPVIHRIW